ncbi:hypothetical protein [Fischerella sp.]|nr:hypothetical protein [Fischerella sp.]
MQLATAFGFTFFDADIKQSQQVNQERSHLSTSAYYQNLDIIDP